MFRSAQARARAKGWEFSITVDDILLPAVCPLLDIPIFASEGHPTGNSPTIDRKDNSRGYVPGNIWVISHRANTIKSDASADELLLIVLRLQTLKVLT